MYWKLMCDVECHKSALALSSTDANGVAALISLRTAEGYLLACDAALDTAASHHGFDGDTVRRIAQSFRYVPLVPGAVSDKTLELDLLAAITFKLT